VLGAVGLVYSGIVVRRVLAQIEYKPHFEDWLFYVLLPWVAYGALVGSAFAARAYASILLSITVVS